MSEPPLENCSSRLANIDVSAETSAVSEASKPAAWAASLGTNTTISSDMTNATTAVGSFTGKR